MNDWNIYPRPQLRRASYLNLNGDWELLPSGRNITVPFSPESKLSGIGQTVSEDELILYRTFFRIPPEMKKNRCILHFGAVDQTARVFVNGQLAGVHEGGYTHFSFDITALIEDDGNELTVEVDDHLEDHILPYGKQRKKRGGIWYTPITGIWQTVWLECVPEHYIKELRIDPDIDCADITCIADTPVTQALTPVLHMDGKSVPMENGKAHLTFSHPHNWTPEDPYLYNFSVTYGEDKVESYFALRTVTTGTVNGIPRILLNGKPYYFHGVLDQGYFADGIYTPKSPEDYEKDIRMLKDCGYNMLRKHIKAEPDIFYYCCDRLGMAVFQDMVNNGRYSFMKDSALPTIGLKKLKDTRMSRKPAVRAAFKASMEETVRQLYNFPCIVYWTIFNEGWGQFCGSEMYDHMKTLDKSRVIDTASGWFSGVKSDVISDHIYFKHVKPAFGDKPYVLSEFGGYAYAVQGHLFNPKKKFGYKGFQELSLYEEAVLMLYETDVLPYVKQGMCADVYTQLSDVEDEINGLVTYDREIVKIHKNRFKEIGERIREEING